MASLGFGEGGIDLRVVGGITKSLVGVGGEGETGGDVELLVGFDKDGFAARLAEAEEQGDFAGMGLGEFAYTVHRIGLERLGL